MAALRPGAVHESLWRMTLKSFRNTLGDSQEQFAARLGLTKMTVWRYEQGEPIPYAIELALKSLTRSLDLSGLKEPLVTPKPLGEGGPTDGAI